ncbi:MAG: MBL fold metallo-hydrolase [Candidatus Delongbacteria bacterium]|nr:MBL fold metallo-hydrolase [Candidatus Delongbacteria bacterium]
MLLTIHRGTNEIGGTCIELQSVSSRILLDFGMPLVNKSGNSFDFSKYRNLSVAELIKQGVLPNLQGAYSDKPAIDGVIISHPHADHYGLMQYMNKDIPVWLGEATHRILELNNIFLHQNNKILDPQYFEKEKPFTIGNFKITAYWNDHSAFDSYSFLIEAENKRVFYSGDFRSHGRKAKAYRWFLHNAPKDIDYLLIEGTTIGRKQEKPKTEDDIKTELTELFKKSPSISYIYTSSQNIDRLVSIYKSCLVSQKTFVVDVYTANVLETLSDFAGLPSPLKGFSNLKVLFPNRLTTSLFKSGHGDLANKFSKSKITKDEISKNPSSFVLLVRPSMKSDLNKIITDSGNLIYSMWEGYKEQTTTKEFIDWLKSKNFTIYDIHTSGHADSDTLKELADNLAPKAIIPIHTFNKQEYKNVFSQKIIELNDNETINI